jgi:hypothetical protein
LQCGHKSPYPAPTRPAFLRRNNNPSCHLFSVPADITQNLKPAQHLFYIRFVWHIHIMAHLAGSTWKFGQILTSA